jgi:hypothetical protein
MSFRGLCLGQVSPDEINYRTIDHLLASVGEIDRYVVADNRLHLAKPPFGPVGVRHEIAKTEIEHEAFPCFMVMVSDQDPPHKWSDNAIDQNHRHDRVPGGREKMAGENGRAKMAGGKWLGTKKGAIRPLLILVCCRFVSSR